MFKLIFVLVMIAVGFAASLFSRFAALLFYLWFAVFRPLDWMWIDIYTYRPSLLIGLTLVVPCLLTGVFPTVSHPLSIGALAFLSATLVAQRHAIAPEVGWYWIDFLGKLILVGLFLVTLTSTRRRLLWVVAVIAGSFAAHSAKAGLASLMGGIVQFGEGLSGAFSDNNAYGIGSVMVVYLLVMTAQCVRRPWIRVAWWLAVPLTLVTVVSTYSRSAFLALVASAFTFVLLQRRRVLLAALLVVALTVALLVVPIPNSYVERLDTIQTYEQSGETSALSRLHFWRVALAMSAAHPFGVGLWNFEPNYNQYDFLDGLYGRERAVHNSHLQVLTEVGWIGAAAWVFLFVYALFICFRIRGRAMKASAAPDASQTMLAAANAMICSMVAFLVGGFFISMAYNDLTWLTFATIAAMDRLSRTELLPASEGNAVSDLPLQPAL